MSTKLIARPILVCLVVLTVCMRANMTLGQRVCCEGDRWLSWSADARQTYVFGFTLGYTMGHSDGCRQGTSNWPVAPQPGIENDPERQCSQQGLDFSQRSDSLTTKITEFYSRYPKDRDIYPNEVLEQLGKGLTIQQIHEHPFLRHHPSPATP